MPLYLITTPWQGNGHEGVIVEANDSDEALDKAAVALTDAADAELGDHPAEWQVKHHAEKVESYRTREAWLITEITLPFVYEFG